MISHLSSFIPSSLQPFHARQPSKLHNKCVTPCMLSSPPSFPRRALSLTLLSFLLPTAAYSYSSPYTPNKSSNTSEKPLPARRYDDRLQSVVRTPSGLEYFDLAVGNGAEAVQGCVAYVYYTARLGGLNGIKIQSSYDEESPSPFIFRIGDDKVVKGVNEAVQGMKVGGKRRAVLKEDIGYQNVDMEPKVKGFFERRRLLSVLQTNREKTIVFDLELIRVKLPNGQ